MRARSRQARVRQASEGGTAMWSRSLSAFLRLPLLFLLLLTSALALLTGLAGTSAWAAAGMWAVGPAVDDLPGESPGLNGVAFTDARHGWLCRFEPNLQVGFVFVTTNGGATWKKQYSFDTSGGVYDVAFPDAKHGWVVGDSVVYTTSDGGATSADGGLLGGEPVELSGSLTPPMATSRGTSMTTVLGQSPHRPTTRLGRRPGPPRTTSSGATPSWPRRLARWPE